jgi:hypothetical protein
MVAVPTPLFTAFTFDPVTAQSDDVTEMVVVSADVPLVVSGGAKSTEPVTVEHCTLPRATTTVGAVEAGVELHAAPTTVTTRSGAKTAATRVPRLRPTVPPSTRFPSLR